MPTGIHGPPGWSGTWSHLARTLNIANSQGYPQNDPFWTLLDPNLTPFGPQMTPFGTLRDLRGMAQRALTVHHPSDGGPGDLGGVWI